MNIYQYNGCGNDFIIVDYQVDHDYHSLAQTLCLDPQFGTDGLIAVKQEPLEMLIFNRDGSQAPMCGNGLRCFANYVYDQQLTLARTFPVETLAGQYIVTITKDSPFECAIEMGQPVYDNRAIAVSDQLSMSQREILIPSGPVTITSLLMGTIHTVVFVDDAKAEVNLTRGFEICHHPLFKEQTNVNFVEVLDEETLIVRTFERGVGWTLACGTGCCASYAVARDLGKITGQRAQIFLEKGQLEISGAKNITMAGPALFEKITPI